MSVQNPTIPTATQAKGIDAVVLDLQTHLDFELSWLTNGMGRAYRLTKVRANQSTVFLPEVYLGTNQFKYFAATPDNDKQGQSIFFVGDATMPDQQKGFYGWVEHEVGIIFSANLNTIDSALLETEDFTEHLIQDVRQALVRDLVGKSYRLNIDTITREFDDVYAEFDVARDRGIVHAPMTHFRVNCTVIFKEDCTGVSLDRCAAILQNLSADDLCSCVIPSLDFTIGNDTDFDCLTGQQVADLTTRLCVTPPEVNLFSMSLDGVDEYITTKMALAGYNIERTDTFTFSFWIKPSVLQEGHIINKFLSPTGYFIRLTSAGEIRLGLFSTLGSIDIRTAAGSIVINQWQHVCITYDASSSASGVSIYIDDVLQTLQPPISDNLTGTLINAETLVFGSYVFAGRYYAGLIDEVRAWDIEFNASQVSTEYNGGSATAEVNEQANNYIAFGCGEGSVFGFTNRHLPDRYQTNALLDGFYASQNMELADMTTDIS